MILENHYSRTVPCVQYAFGLFTDKGMVGCVTYGQPASPSLCIGVAGKENRHLVLELNRLVVTDDAPNHASYLVSHSLRLLPRPTIVVSYADVEGWGHVGKVYQACHFLYTGMTKSRTDKKSASGGHSRHYEPGETGRQYRTAKHRYVRIHANRADTRRLTSELRYPVLPYPKGESRRYDTESPVPLRGRELDPPSDGDCGQKPHV